MRSRLRWSVPPLAGMGVLCGHLWWSTRYDAFTRRAAARLPSTQGTEMFGARAAQQFRDAAQRVDNEAGTVFVVAGCGACDAATAAVLSVDDESSVRLILSADESLQQALEVLRAPSLLQRAF
eukprot:7357521-Prymnesium_polylepis.2